MNARKHSRKSRSRNRGARSIKRQSVPGRPGRVGYRI